MPVFGVACTEGLFLSLMLNAVLFAVAVVFYEENQMLHEMMRKQARITARRMRERRGDE